MNAIESIVSLYKSRCQIRFDKDVAESLGIAPKAFSSYLKGRTKLPDIVMMRIADAADIEPVQVFAAMNLTYQKTPTEELEYWQERYKTLMM